MYLVDFMEHTLSPAELDSDEKIIQLIMDRLHEVSQDNMEKLVGIAMPIHVDARFPTLGPRLWREMDIIPLVLPEEFGQKEGGSYEELTRWSSRTIDEEAESMGRKCVRFASMRLFK